MVYSIVYPLYITSVLNIYICIYIQYYLLYGSYRAYFYFYNSIKVLLINININYYNSNRSSILEYLHNSKLLLATIHNIQLS